MPAANPTVSQTISAETPRPTELYQTLLEVLHKANQDNKLMKKAIKKATKQIYKEEAKNQATAKQSKSKTVNAPASLATYLKSNDQDSA